MQNEELNCAVEKLPPLVILVAYEDKATRDHAIRVCDHLVAQLQLGIEFVFSWWRFDFLGEPSLALDAAVQASAADVVLFSMHARSELPLAVKQWIESWVDKKHNS